MIFKIKSQSLAISHKLEYPTLFHEILESDLPRAEKSVTRLKDEALVILGAGTLTNSWALSLATYHLLSLPEVLLKLRTELTATFPDANAPTTLPQLEALPYLNAVIKEAFRLSYGVASRLQRISPDKPLIYMEEASGRTWTIPKGTPVGMTSVLLHHNEAIFPNSHAFIPERWIDKPRLGKYLVSFSKGSRQCLGINLAYAEMYLCLAAIFRRFGCPSLDKGECGGEDGREGIDDDEGKLELFETGPRDVEISADYFVPMRAADSKGIRIRVHR